MNLAGNVAGWMGLQMALLDIRATCSNVFCTMPDLRTKLQATENRSRLERLQSDLAVGPWGRSMC